MEKNAFSTVLVENFCQLVGMFRSPSDSTFSFAGCSPLASSSRFGGLNLTLCNLSEHAPTALKVGVARTFIPSVIIVAMVGWRFQIIARESSQHDQCDDSLAFLALLNSRHPRDKGTVTDCRALAENARDPNQLNETFPHLSVVDADCRSCTNEIRSITIWCSSVFLANGP